MKLWDKLFGNKMTSRDVFIAVKGLEAKGNTLSWKVSAMEREKEDLVKRAADARKRGQNHLVKQNYRKLQIVESQMGRIDKELDNCTKLQMVLTDKAHALKGLEDRKDTNGALRILEDLKGSELVTQLRGLEIDEEVFRGELEEGVRQIESKLGADSATEDLNLRTFEATLDRINETGDVDESVSKHLKEINLAIKGKSAEGGE